MRIFLKPFLFLLAGTPIYAQASKLSADLQIIDHKSNVPVIMEFGKDPGDTYHQKILSRGGSWKATLHSLKAGALPSRS